MKGERKEIWERGFCIEGMTEGLNDVRKGRREVEMKKGVLEGKEGIKE